MAQKPTYKWQRQKVYPNSGQMFDSEGNIVDVAEYYRKGSTLNVWPFGETMTGAKMDDITLQFQYPFINEDFDFRPAVTTGDGVVQQSNSMLQVSSVTGSANIKSRNLTSYRPGHSGYIDFTAMFSGTGQAIVGGDDAFQIRYDNGELHFGYVKGGVFVGSPVDTTDIDLNTLNIWRIVYGYLGSATPMLFIKQGVFKKVASIETEGVLQSTHLDDPNFSAVFETSGDCTLSSGSFAAGVIGTERTTGFRTFSFPSSPVTSGVGSEEGDASLVGSDVLTIAIIRSKEIYQTINNSVASFLYRWENYVSPPDNGSGEVIFQVILNPVLTDVPTYIDIDTQNSTLQVDHTSGTGASVSYSSGGRVLLQKQVPYLEGQGNKPGVGTFSAIDAEQLGAVLTAGDVICIIAKDKAGNDVDVRTSLSWRERF